MSNEAVPDFIKDLDFSEEKVAESDLAKLSKLAAMQKAAEDHVEKLVRQLAEAEAKLAQLAEDQIPNLMESLGMKTFTTTEGLCVSIKSGLRASIPQEDKDKQSMAFAWLEKEGHDGVIKREFKIEFGRNELTWAKKFEGDLKKRKKQLRVSRKETVHPKTLSALLSEQMGKGVNIPLEYFNAQPYKKAEIK